MQETFLKRSLLVRLKSFIDHLSCSLKLKPSKKKEENCSPSFVLSETVEGFPTDTNVLGPLKVEVWRSFSIA